MLKVGITGGIGSGKTTVCQVFETLGIPVFYADYEAKQLIERNDEVVNQIKLLFGEDIYGDGGLNRERVASIVFNDPTLLEKLNNIVHPAILRYANQWMEKQNAPYVLKEAAIFFESGSNKDMDFMIGVYAPEETRIGRVMERDKVGREKVLKRMSQQMKDADKMKLCDHVIVNDDVSAIIPQVLEIHQILLSKQKDTTWHP